MNFGRATKRADVSGTAAPVDAVTTRVLELCLSPAKGGLELYVLRVARHLAASKVVAFTVVAPGSELEERLGAESLPYRLLRVRFRWFPLTAARRLAGWIDTEAIDALHIHWARDLHLAVLARAMACRPVRIVYTRQMAITRPKHDWYHRMLYRRVDLMIAITKRLQEEARRFLPLAPEKVRVLYHGVAAPSRPCDCASLRRDLNIPAGRFVVALFGRIEPAKGQHVLVDAVARLVSRGADVHAVLYGHPMAPCHLRDLETQIARLGVNDRVTYAGYHHNPQEIMGCFDCVVLTTYNETFGLVLIEAMRAGTAVIGTNAGGVPEIIEHEKTGLLVPPGDPAALADAIERLVSDRELRDRLAAAGKRSADERFDEDQHFARLTELLKEIAR